MALTIKCLEIEQTRSLSIDCGPDTPFDTWVESHWACRRHGKCHWACRRHGARCDCLRQKYSDLKSQPKRNLTAVRRKRGKCWWPVNQHCQSVFYCCKKCQRSDWSKHKVACTAIADMKGLLWTFDVDALALCKDSACQALVVLSCKVSTNVTR